MTHDEAWALCSELESLLADAQAGAAGMLRRAHQIETLFFSDLQADSYLLTTVARVVDDLEDLLGEGGEPDAEARALLLEGPMRDSLERLKSAVAMSYAPAEADRGPARRFYAGEARRHVVLTTGGHS